MKKSASGKANSLRNLKIRKPGIATGIRGLLLSFIKLIHTAESRRKQEHKDERKNGSTRSMRTPYIHIMAPSKTNRSHYGQNKPGRISYKRKKE